MSSDYKGPSLRDIIENVCNRTRVTIEVDDDDEFKSHTSGYAGAQSGTGLTVAMSLANCLEAIDCVDPYMVLAEAAAMMASWKEDEVSEEGPDAIFEAFIDASKALVERQKAQWWAEAMQRQRETPPA